MNTKLIGLGIMLLTLCTQAIAQVAPEPKQSFDFKNTDLQQALATVGRQYGAKVVVQEGLKATVTAKAANVNIETALTMIAAPNELTWRVFVIAVKPGDQVTGKTLGELMAALDRIQYAGLVAYDTKQTGGVRFEKTLPTTELVGTICPDGSKYTTFYYVYDARPKAAATTTSDVGRRSVRNQAAANQTELSSGQVIKWFMGLTPQAKKQVLDSLIGITELDQMTPDNMPPGGAPDDERFGPDE